MNTDNNPRPLIIFVVAAITVLLVYAYMERDDEVQTHRKLGAVMKRSLRECRDITVEVDGKTAVCIFTRGEDMNVANLTWGVTELRRTDLNKSKLLGEWAGEKAKQGTKGFIEGFRKDKHSEGDENVH